MRSLEAAQALAMRHPAFAIRARSHGSALIVTLVLLLVVTVAGIAGMAGTVLQERMAGNLQDSTQVFEATEGALRRCADRVVNGNTSASGTASATVVDNFNAGQSVASPGSDHEYYVPGQLGSELAAQGGTSYQLACLIEFDGPIDASRVGGSLRGAAPSGSLVGYTVMASGARLPSGGGTQRPSVILEARVVLRR